MPHGALARYEAPVPKWTEELKEEVRQKALATTLIPAMQRGDLRAIHAFLLGFWSFVDAFPGTIEKGRARVFKTAIRNYPFEVRAIGANATALMRKDESDHRTLWTISASEVGLTYAELEMGRTHYPKTQLITDLVGDETADPATLLLRFMAVEMVAETVSDALLYSAKFLDVVPKRGCGWFVVHVEHVATTGTPHEEVTFRLANALTDDGVQEETAKKIILEVADVFAEAANAAHLKVVA